jgi:hypothetical protein
MPPQSASQMGCITTIQRSGKSGRGTSTYNIWVMMKQRCHNPRCKDYPNYGGRGIRVCSRWINSFANFLKDMGERPPGMQLDRLDNSGDYEPSNCRWATFSQQARNRRSNVVITFRGRSMVLTDWAKELGINWGTLKGRINRGWSVARVLSTPVERQKSHKRK